MGYVVFWHFNPPGCGGAQNIVVVFTESLKPSAFFDYALCLHLYQSLYFTFLLLKNQNNRLQQNK